MVVHCLIKAKSLAWQGKGTERVVESQRTGTWKDQLQEDAGTRGILQRELYTKEREERDSMAAEKVKKKPEPLSTNCEEEKRPSVLLVVSL